MDYPRAVVSEVGHGLGSAVLVPGKYQYPAASWTVNVDLLDIARAALWEDS